jgi:hypothetical protein
MNDNEKMTKAQENEIFEWIRDIAAQVIDGLLTAEEGEIKIMKLFKQLK